MTDAKCTERLPADRGFADRAKMTRGPGGNWLCRRCANECTGSRARTFCSPACVHEWRSRTDPAYQARHVLERDKGVCAICRVDTIAASKELRGLWNAARADMAGWSWWVARPDWIPIALREWEIARQRLGWSLKRALSSSRAWDMDHIVPVVEGGGSCGLENLRTLCPACHTRVTNELRARLKAARVRGATL